MEIFDDAAGPMSRGERAALDGVLGQRRPELAIAIGTAGSRALDRVAAHAAEVHAFDADAPPPGAERLPAVRFHAGEPTELLRTVLAALATAGRNVDFVLLAADATPGGTRSNLEALLDSPALADTVILIHAVADERVRPEVEAVRFAAWPKVACVEIDFLPGYMLAGAPVRHRLAGGLALVLVDAARPRYPAGSVIVDRVFPTAALLAEVRDYVVAREASAGPGAPYGGTPVDPTQARLVADLQRELAEAEAEARRLRSVARHHEELWRSLMDSWSWRLTEPIRMAKERARGGG